MDLKHAISNLHPVARNTSWLASNLTAREKLRYYPALVRALLNRDADVRTVDYCGQQFVYDNVATPLNLQSYPYEVGTLIGRHLAVPPRRILDIGGNIGQFSVTAHRFWPDAVIDVLEPNPAAFDLLAVNTGDIDNIYTFCAGIGDGGPLKFWFEEGRSATGSFDRRNIDALGSNIQEIEVETVDDVTDLTDCDTYDLFKIDVEGFEVEAMKHLGNITARFLFVEGSSDRARSYSHSEFWAQIAETFGPFDMLHVTEVQPDHPTFEALLEFDPPAGDSSGGPRS
jgi:FkbM family methyltransferase